MTLDDLIRKLESLKKVLATTDIILCQDGKVVDDIMMTLELDGHEPFIDIIIA